MDIQKILVSQPEPKNKKSPFYELAEKKSLEVDFRPFIKVEGITAKEFRKTRVNVLDYGAIVFTSRTGIDHFFRICEECRINIPETMKYFCINESTAYYLQKYIVYRKRKIFYGNGEYADLIPLIKKHKNEHFLVPVSDTHKEIPRLLKKNKISYKKVIFYRTISCDLSDLASVNYDILVFYSPSGIKSLLENFPDFEQNNTKIASFGKKTAKAVKDAGLRLDIKAPNAKSPSMTMAIEQFIDKHNHKEQESQYKE